MLSLIYAAQLVEWVKIKRTESKPDFAEDAKE